MQCVVRLLNINAHTDKARVCTEQLRHKHPFQCSSQIMATPGDENKEDGHGLILSLVFGAADLHLTRDRCISLKQ